MKLKTHEQFLKDFYLKNPMAKTIKILDEYKGNKIKIKCRCLIHDYVWESTPNNLLFGGGCPKCGLIRNSLKRTKTQEKFLEELKVLNPNVKIMSSYKNTNTKVQCKCLIDGNIWEATPDALLRGRGCPICGRQTQAQKQKKSHNDFINELQKINPDIIVLEEYKNNKTKIKCYCKTHNIVWEITPSDLLQGKGCKQCGIDKLSRIKTKTHKQFIKRMSIVSPDILIKSQYIRNTTNILCQCRICGREWEAPAYNLLSGRGCPHCKATYGEQKIRSYLELHKIQYFFQYKFQECKNIFELPFDFYLPQYNMCIEYDGQQHFKPVSFSGDKSVAEQNFAKTQYNDKIKNKYCQDNNIFLLRIGYWDFKNIEQILNKHLFSS